MNLLLLSVLFIGGCLSAPDLNFQPINEPVPVCEDGWKRYGSLKCIKFTNEHFSYEEGETYCRDQYSGAHMVTIHTEEEQQILHDYIYRDLHLGYPTWIGAKQIDFENILWLDRTQSSYVNWAPKEPSSTNEICISMLPESGKWADSFCNSTAIPMCERAPIKRWPFYIPFCREGWFQYKDQKCIRVVSTTALNFHESQEYCRAKYNAKLTTIAGPELQEFLSQVLQFKEVRMPVWLGAVQNDFTAFHWIDRSEVNYTNWDDNEPNDPDEICLAMWSDTGKWADVRCNERKLVVCQRNLPKVEKVQCEGGWLQNGYKCFRVVHMRLTFDESVLMCSKLYKATLPSIHSREEQQLLIQFFESVNVKNGTEVWIGGKQVDFNYFNWVDGSKLNFTNWDVNEPNEPEDKCIEMAYLTGKWNDVDCSKQRFVICEKPTSTALLKKPALYTEPVTNAGNDEDYQDFADRTVPKTGSVEKQAQAPNDIAEVNTVVGELSGRNDPGTVTPAPVGGVTEVA